MAIRSHQKTRKRAVAEWCCVFTSQLIFTACGTLYNLAVPESPLSFTSSPDHATIKVKGYEPCKTPCVIRVDPVKEVRIRAELPGHDDKTKWATTRVSFPVFANILLGVPLLGLGLVVDWGTDSLVTWSETKYHFKLSRTEESDDEDDSGDEEDGDDVGNSSRESEPPSTGSVAPAKPAALPVQPPPPPVKKPDAPTPMPEVPPSFVNQVKDTLLTSDRMHLIDQYYGKVSVSQRQRIENRLIKELFEMSKTGEELDLDEAIRRDQFRENEAARKRH